MKKLIVFLMLMQVWAISLTKTVSGPELIDVNESLDVTLTVVSDGEYIERLEDDVPEHFVAAVLPSACRQTESMVLCNFGQEIQGRTTVNYKLIAIGTGAGFLETPRLYYSGGLKTIDFFQSYFIGKPRILLSLEGDSTLLPDEDIIVSVSMENPGTRSIDGADLNVEYGSNRIEEVFSLSPGEVIVEEYTLGKSKTQGSLGVYAHIAWDNSSASDSMNVVFIAPSIDVVRDIEVEWEAVDGELNEFVQVTYSVRNNGTAPGNATFQSGESFIIEPGETKKVVKRYDETAPAEKISIRDSRGYSYGMFSFGEITPEVNKSFDVLVYEHVASKFSPWMLIGIFLGAIYFSTKFKNANIKAGFFVIALVSGLLLYSSYSVGVLKIPGFGPKPSGDSVSLQLPGKLSNIVS